MAACATLEQALAAYEAKMRHRVAAVAEETQQLLDLMHGENNQQTFLAVFAAPDNTAGSQTPH